MDTIQREITPVQELQFLFQYIGNIKLYNEAKQFVIKSIDFKKYQFKEGITNDHVINLLALEHINRMVFPVLEAVYLFNNDPFKCISWIRGTLNRVAPEYAEIIKSHIMTVINDKKRFQNESNDLIFIRQEISIIDCTKLDNEPRITYKMLEYFLGKDFTFDYYKFLRSFLAVRGLLKNESDIVRDFINEHREEITRQLKEEFETIREVFQIRHSLSNGYNQKTNINPVFKPEEIPTILNILRGYFSPEHQAKLKQLLESGVCDSGPLLFKGHGKTLLSFFKQLVKGQILLIGVQMHLQEWIAKNFMYLDGGTPKNFIPKRAGKVISGNEDAAKGNRLIDVISEGGVFKIIQLEIKNRQQE